MTVTQFKTEVPAFIDRAQAHQAARPSRTSSSTPSRPTRAGRFLATLLLGFLPTILLVGFFVWLSRRQAGRAGGVLGGFGRSTARRVKPGEQERVTFDDVAGIDEAEDELVEVVDFLKNPQRYTKLGARIPRGVLLYGPPGTGKTLLARAVAGEADAAFFSMSASEFVEAIVGVGASRVRDLFKQAKEAAPAIVFIDELDAIGRSRSGNVGGISGGHDEREQTLNQILTEMDGFEPGTNVIVLGATNRPEILDPALLRPGRFDRRIAVQPPDRNGRVEILKIHTRSVPLAPDVDLERIAASTPGATGADIALLVNEAALFAARRDHTAVEQRDFTDAIEKIILGAERQVVMTDADRERTAYHESGHALVGMLTPGADPVRKVSIIPRGQALGVTLSTPETDRFNYARDELVAQDQGGARRPRGGEGRLRRHHDRRGVGHPEPHADRPRHGRPLGDERRDRPDRGHRRPRRTAPAARLGARLARDPAARRRGGAADRRGGRARRDRAARARARAASTRWPTRCWSARRSTNPRPTGSPESRSLRSSPRRTHEQQCPRSGRRPAQSRHAVFDGVRREGTFSLGGIGGARSALGSAVHSFMPEFVVRLACERRILIPVSRDFRGRRKREAEPDRLPPGQYATDDFPVLSAGPTPHTPLEKWTFSIVDGDEPRSWSWGELHELPSETSPRTSTA